MFTSALVIFKPSWSCIEVAKKLTDHLRRRGIEVESAWVDDLYRIEGKEFSLIALVGGDGTFLRFSRLAGKILGPIFPVPCGRRTAFYEEINPEELGSFVDRLFSGDFFIEYLPRARVVIENREYNALNEVMVVNVDQGRVGSFKLTIKTPSVSTELEVESDGVIVGPSPGSSAYNLSARGPLMDFSYLGLFVNFLNPLQLNLTPIVLPFTSKVVVEPEVVSSVYVDGEKVSSVYNTPVEATGSWEWLRVVRFRAPRGWILDVLAKRALN
ncbi:ATP-NAD/AcoX kinase [Thermogladius calderae 1633]|uniref:ATP-NAD/AcoX kinase n=1 Tax=Thermogladius calderae (strain DSM 22663 / VKM B-2946 / 1633) TaxID=1184251 RepID=I3TE05_THEC1|nr:ATP-NAD/AcoX kinase [Thermogladius calderae 1633]